MSKKTVVLAAACLLAMVSFKAAEAETLDVATIKCSDMANMTADQVGIMLAWMDGYMGGRAEDTRLDMERLQYNAEAADKACAQDPNAGLLSVLKAAEQQ